MPIKPVIKVWCMPKLREAELRMIFVCIVTAVESVKELGLRGKESIVVLFPPDMMKYGLGSEIVVEVTNLPADKGRAKETRDRLAHALWSTLQITLDELAPAHRHIQCVVNPPKRGASVYCNPRMGRRRPATADDLKKK